jgi:hypothetical protein
MEWDKDAKEQLELVPAEFLAKAVRETENYAKENNYSCINLQVVEKYKKKLGF